MFQHVQHYPGDPILTLNEAFQADPRPDKINLSIGVFLNDLGQMPAMSAVIEAEAALAQSLGPRPYLPMEGHALYRRCASELIFGKDASRMGINIGNIASVQTLGGSGALRIGADFLAHYFPAARAWVSTPTWDNHYSIFAGAGIDVQGYSYYDDTSGKVDFSGMLSDLGNVSPGDIVVLHTCCHNPTGADLNKQQWRELAGLIRARGLLPFFDMAYQGFSQGLDEDAFAIRYFAANGIPMLVANSFSKNFGLYGERCGLLSVVCNSADHANNVLGQLKATVRRNYSSPPTHGARIIASVLGNPVLQGGWKEELDAMRVRVAAMRLNLHATLSRTSPDNDFTYLLSQSGMFSFTGLTGAEVRHMRNEHGIYLLESGRICLAALTAANINRTAAAIAGVLHDR